MESVNSKYQAIYNTELKSLLHRRSYTILWVGSIMVPVFAVLDYFVSPEHFRQFFIWRLMVTLYLFFSILLTSRDKRQQYSISIVTSAIFITACMISAMIIQLGGYSSTYYVGLILLLVIYSAIFPLTMTQTAILGGGLFSIYAVPIFISTPLSQQSLNIFLSNSFFFITFILISVVQNKTEDESRKKEFNLRMKEQEIGTQLSYYADKLENEVKTRSLELQEQESHYHDLYENIIDDVILVDLDGKILLANPRFFSKMGIPYDDQQNIVFLDLLPKDDVIMTQRNLIDPLQKGKNVTNYQFKLPAQGGGIIHVECNATIIRKENVLVGFQMLLRDISAQKKMEEKLLESLKTVKNTRSATILGLAKLSEYRDVGSGNHLERTREYCHIIARELSLQPKYADTVTEEFIDDLYHSSILHDIGKVSVPDEILFKTENMTAEDTAIIRKHTTYGGNILKAVDSELKGQSFLSMAKSIAYCHHEKWDGSGFPYGLREEEIPLAARIVSLADMYDTLSARHAYGTPCLHQEAVEIISREKGSSFAPDVVDAFLKNEQKFEEINQKYSSEHGKNTFRILSSCYRKPRTAEDANPDLLTP